MKNRGIGCLAMIYIGALTIICKASSDLDFLINDLSATSILENHNKSLESHTEKRFSNDFLLFVTPWNRQGFSLALKNAKKLDYICPVWFDLKSRMLSKNTANFYIEGHHNVDVNWLEQLKSMNPRIKIYPRIYLDTRENENLQNLASKDQLENLVDQMIALTKQYSIFDGIMFDSPLINYIKQLSFDLTYLVQFLGDRLADMDKGLILSFMPKHKGMEIKYSLQEKFFLAATKILIMTYDYSSNSPGEFPLSPILWFEENIKSYFEGMSLSSKIIQNKLMIGLPFYGYEIDYTKKSKNAIIHERYLDLLGRFNPKLEWNEKYQECFIKVRDANSNSILDISYPCLKFIEARLRLAREYGVGVFVWEGGQGLEYFYSVF